MPWARIKPAASKSLTARPAISREQPAIRARSLRDTRNCTPCGCRIASLRRQSPCSACAMRPATFTNASERIFLIGDRQALGDLRCEREVERRIVCSEVRETLVTHLGDFRATARAYRCRTWRIGVEQREFAKEFTAAEQGEHELATIAGRQHHL